MAQLQNTGITGSLTVSGTITTTGASSISASNASFTAITGSVLFLGGVQKLPILGEPNGLGSSEVQQIIASSSIYMSGSVTAGRILANGLPIHPTFNFSNATSTGMYVPSNGALAFSVAGAETVRLERGSGFPKLGVNESSPQGMIHATLFTSSADTTKIILENQSAGNTNATYEILAAQGLRSKFMSFPYNAAAFGEWNNGAVLHVSGTTGLSNLSNLHYSAVTHKWYKNAGSGSSDRTMTLNSSGNLGIGNSDPQQRLVVSGNISATGTGVVSGSTAQFSVISASNFIVDGTIDVAQNAYIQYNDPGDNLLIFPGLNGVYVTGSVTTWQGITVQTGTVTAPTASFGSFASILSVTSSITGSSFRATSLGASNAVAVAVGNDPGVGIFSPSINFLGFAANSNEVARMRDFRLEMAQGGAPSGPAYTWNGDNNTGMYSPGSDQLAFSTGGGGRLFLTTTSISASVPITGSEVLFSTASISRFEGTVGFGTGSSSNYRMLIKEFSTNLAAIRIEGYLNTIGFSIGMNGNDAQIGSDRDLILRSNSNNYGARLMGGREVDLFGGVGGSGLGRVMMFQEGTQVAGIPYGSYDFVVSGTIGSTSQGRLRFANSGTAAFPMITGLNDTNTGIYFPSADTVSISTNGVERLKITGSGDMTIAAVSGTTAQFTTVSASNFFPIDNAVKYPLVLNTGETGLPGWEILGLNTDGGASTISTNGSNLVPFWFSEPISVKSVNFVISSGSTGAGLMDLSIWGCQRSTGSAGFIPVTRVYNTSSIDVSTIGSRTITSGFPLTLEPGLYSVVLTTNNQVNSRSFLFNAPGARMARFTVSGPQLAVIQRYFANTGYPASTTWTAPVDLSVAYGAIGYRAEAAIDWTSSSL